MLKSINFEAIKTIEEGIDALNAALLELEDMAEKTDFTLPASTEVFCENIAFIKRYYERLEELLLDSTKA
jgi:hypothetical protein